MPPSREQQGRLPETVIVSGATGFIGRNLVRRLAGRCRVVALSRSGGAVPGADLNLAMDALDGLRTDPDTVFVHLAAPRYDAANFRHSQSELLIGNVDLAGRVYDYCLRRGISEVRLASSIAVYPGDLDLLDDAAAIDLSRDPAPSEVMYGWAKRTAEVYARLYGERYGINTVILRPSNPYGPEDSLSEDKAHVVAAFILRALTGEGPFQVRGNPNASRDFIHVDDVCEAFVRSLGWRERSGAWNLATGRNTTIGSLAETILRLSGRPRPIVVEGEATSDVVGRRCKVERLKRDFGFDRFLSIEEGLMRTLEWYRSMVTGKGP